MSTPSSWTLERQRRRAERERAWGERVARINRLSCSPRFGVILTDDLTAADLPEAAPDCVVFLWTHPEDLPAALDALDRWGFDYRTGCVISQPPRPDAAWSHFIIEHALVLVARKGDIAAPAPGTQYSSVLKDVDELYAMLRAYFPNVPTKTGCHRMSGIRKRLRTLQAQYPDWKVERDSKHLKLIHRATGRCVFTPLTPYSEWTSDHYLRRKVERVLREIGA
jgi:hypothetical protein